MAVDYTKLLGKKYSSLMENAPSLYTMKSDDDLRNEATAYYSPQYESDKASAETGYNTSSASLANQLSQIAPTYAGKRTEANKASKTSQDTLVGNGLKSGMGRSTYVMQKNQSLLDSLASNIAGINEQETQATNTINQQKSALDASYATQKANLDNEYQGNMLTKMQELKQREQDKKTEAEQARANYVLQTLGVLK